MSTPSIYVAGHSGMVGSALTRELLHRGHSADNLILPLWHPDLRDTAEVNRFICHHRPEQIYIAAAKVGGIFANQASPVDFLHDNLLIALNLLHAAHEYGVSKVLYLASSCIYPRNCPQPMKEEHLLSGPLEPTNEGYALAKLAGIKLCQFYRKQHGCNFISAIPCNLYGPGDSYDPARSHVIPALIRKFHEARLAGLLYLMLPGTGRALREFLHVDDLAKACVDLMEGGKGNPASSAVPYDGSDPINIGSGSEIRIDDLAHDMAGLINYQGEILFSYSNSDGAPRKLLDCSRLRSVLSGWKPSIGLPEGLGAAYKDFLSRFHPQAKERLTPIP